LTNKNANLQEIADLLSTDAAISSKLISISNSAFYRGVSENKTLRNAISRLGIQITKQYVDTLLQRSLFANKNKKISIFLEALWEHSLACAYASQILTESLRIKLQEDAFTLALMHDIGKLVLFQVIAELQMKKKLGDQIEDKEILETVESHHVKFGASLLKLWKFSGDYIEIARYHDTIKEIDSISDGCLIVHFSNLLVKSLGYGYSEALDADLLETFSAKKLNINPEIIENTSGNTKRFMDEMSQYFK